jgi:hypothetical protein
VAPSPPASGGASVQSKTNGVRSRIERTIARCTPIAFAVNYSDDRESSFVRLVQIFFNHCFDFARRNGVQIEYICDLDRKRFFENR